MNNPEEPKMELDERFPPKTPVAKKPVTKTKKPSHPLLELLSNTSVRVGLIVAVVIIAIIATTLAVYTRPTNNSFVERVVNIAPYPAATVGWTPVWMSEYLEEYKAITKYFETLETADLPEEGVISETIMDTLINKIAVRTLANQYDVELDQARVEEELAAIMTTTGAEEFEAELLVMFGWNIEEFTARVVEPMVLAEQVSEFVSVNEEAQAGQKAKADAAHERIANGEDFMTVAAEVYAATGIPGDGDLGTVSVDDIPEEWAEIIEGLEIGDVSEVSELVGGYYLFSVAERTVTEDGAEEVHLLGFMVPEASITVVVEEYLDSVNIWRFVGQEIEEVEIAE